MALLFYMVIGCCGFIVCILPNKFKIGGIHMSDVAIISLVGVIISSIMLILKLIEMYSNKTK